MKTLPLTVILLCASSSFASDQSLYDEIARDASVNALAYNEIIKHIESGNINEAKSSACGWLETRLLILNEVKTKVSESAKVTVDKAINHIVATKKGCNIGEGEAASSAK